MNSNPQSTIRNPQLKRNSQLNRRIWSAAQLLNLAHDQVSDINHLATGHRISENSNAEDQDLFAELRARMKGLGLKFIFKSPRSLPHAPRKKYYRHLNYRDLPTRAQLDMINALSADLGLSIHGIQSISRRVCKQPWAQTHGDADAMIAALKSMLRRKSHPFVVCRFIGAFLFSFSMEDPHAPKI